MVRMEPLQDKSAPVAPAPYPRTMHEMSKDIMALREMFVNEQEARRKEMESLFALLKKPNSIEGPGPSDLHTEIASLKSLLLKQVEIMDKQQQEINLIKSRQEELGRPPGPANHEL